MGTSNDPKPESAIRLLKGEPISELLSKAGMGNGIDPNDRISAQLAYSIEDSYTKAGFTFVGFYNDGKYTTFDFDIVHPQIGHSSCEIEGSEPKKGVLIFTINEESDLTYTYAAKLQQGLPSSFNIEIHENDTMVLLEFPCTSADDFITKLDMVLAVAT